MDPAALTVIAKFTSKSGKEARVKEELQMLLASTRKEQGYIAFDLHQSVDSEGILFFFEEWTSREALNRHLETPHVKKFLSLVDELLEKPIKASFWKKIA